MPKSLITYNYLKWSSTPAPGDKIDIDKSTPGWEDALKELGLSSKPFFTLMGKVKIATVTEADNRQ